MESERILGVRVDATSHAEATARILAWARAGESRYVCAANVHMVMEAFDSPAFAAVLEKADLVTPDGMPLVFYLRAAGRAGQERVYGPDLMLHLCAAAAREAVPVALVGATAATLEELAARLTRRHPGLQIAFRFAPPFADELDAATDDDLVAGLAGSGARLVFVGLGCPKQERWMAAHVGRVRAPMIGVGAAFDFHAGRVKQAPALMQRAGLEWLFRLWREPRRLASRYLKHNPRFAVLAARELAARRILGHPPRGHSP